MATAKSNGASFDKDEAVNNCAGDNGGVAPIVSEVGTKLENLHLGGNPGCSSAVTHDDDFSLQKGTYRKQLTVKRKLMVNMKYLNDKLQSVKKSELIYVTSIFNKIESLYNEFQVGLNNITAHQIELDCQRAELRAMYDLEKGKAKAKAAAAEAAAAEAEAEARLRVAQARLDAEEKLLSLSERGSCITGGSRRSRKSYYSRNGVTFGREKSH